MGRFDWIPLAYPRVVQLPECKPCYIFYAPDVNTNGGMDLIAVCPKLIHINSEGTFFRGFITAEVLFWHVYIC